MNEILLAYIFNELMQSQTSLYRKSNNLYKDGGAHPPTPPSDPCTVHPSVTAAYSPSPDEPGKLDDPKASYFVNPPLV